MTNTEMLAKLVDSDTLSDSTFNWTQDYQREILAILLHDRPFSESVSIFAIHLF